MRGAQCGTRRTRSRTAGRWWGLAAGLEAATAPVALVVGCDLPFLRPLLLRLLAERALAGARLVVPVHEGERQLLCAAWSRGGAARGARRHRGR